MTGHLYPAPRFGHTMVCVPPVSMMPGDMTASMTPSPGRSAPVRLLLFGGMNSMYCANDMWQLRVRRRRTRFMLPGFGPEGSGSDDEDWVSSGEEDGGQGGVPSGAEAPVDARALVAWNARGRDAVAGAGVDVGAAVGAGVTLGPSGRASGDGGAGSEWQAILTDMQEQLLDLKMQLSVAQQRSGASLAPLTLSRLFLSTLPTSLPPYLLSLVPSLAERVLFGRRYAGERVVRERVEGERDAALAREAALQAALAAEQAACQEAIARAREEVCGWCACGRYARVVCTLLGLRH